MKINNDLTRVLTKVHNNKWVAFSPDLKKVVAFSKDLMNLKKEVGSKKVVYFKVPSSESVFVF